MKIGAFDREIVLEGKTSGKSAGGEPTETWTPLDTGGVSPGMVWSNVTGLSGREYYAAAAAQIVAEETLRFTFRWRGDVRPGTVRVQYLTRAYNIRRVVELGRRQWLQVEADSFKA
jgi:SPP1 family predicted phage head-tail adaptor